MAGLNQAESQKVPPLQEGVIFLGHVVSDEDMSTDPEKIRAVCEWPTPTSASSLKFPGSLFVLSSVHPWFYEDCVSPPPFDGERQGLCVDARMRHCFLVA